MTLLIVCLLFLFLGGVLVQLKRSRALRRLQQGSRVAATAKGPVEYAAIGSGPVVLLLHGGVGGWDQGVILGVSLLTPMTETASYERALRDGDSLLRELFTVIAPSRVGYLRTPLSTGRTPAEGADAMASLLDALGLSRVLVVGISGGGPTALQFALRHAERCAALVMVAAIAKRHVQPSMTTDSIVGKIMLGRSFDWLVDFFLAVALAWAAVWPMSLTKKLLQATETLDQAGIGKRLSEIRRNRKYIVWMRGLLRTVYPLSVRRVGLDNDLAQFASIEDYPVERIACPTLVVHGRNDGNVPFDHAEFVARGVPGSELFVAETCGHFVWMSEEEAGIRQAVGRFLMAHASSADFRMPKNHAG